MQRQRLFGAFCLLLLLALCVSSLDEARKNWGKMPPTEYVAEHMEEFEGIEVYLDGFVHGLKTEEQGASFLLTPGVAPPGSFGSVHAYSRTQVRELQENNDRLLGVNVHGNVSNGVLEASEVSISLFDAYYATVFNAAGFVLFAYFCLKEWTIKKNPPFIEVRK